MQEMTPSSRAASLQQGVTWIPDHPPAETNQPAKTEEAPTAAAAAAASSKQQQRQTGQPAAAEEAPAAAAAAAAGSSRQQQAAGGSGRRAVTLGIPAACQTGAETPAAEV